MTSRRAIRTGSWLGRKADSNDVAALLGNPQFKNNITVGKVMKIIQALIDSEKASDVLANQFEVEQVMVDLIKGFVKR